MLENKAWTFAYAALNDFGQVCAKWISYIQQIFSPPQR